MVRKIEDWVNPRNEAYRLSNNRRVRIKGGGVLPEYVVIDEKGGGAIAKNNLTNPKEIAKAIVNVGGTKKEAKEIIKNTRFEGKDLGFSIGPSIENAIENEDYNATDTGDMTEKEQLANLGNRQQDRLTGSGDSKPFDESGDLKEDISGSVSNNTKQENNSMNFNKTVSNVTDKAESAISKGETVENKLPLYLIVVVVSVLGFFGLSLGD